MLQFTPGKEFSLIWDESAFNIESPSLSTTHQPALFFTHYNLLPSDQLAVIDQV